MLRGVENELESEINEQYFAKIRKIQSVNSVKYSMHTNIIAF